MAGAIRQPLSARVNKPQNLPISLCSLLNEDYRVLMVTEWRKSPGIRVIRKILALPRLRINREHSERSEVLRVVWVARLAGAIRQPLSARVNKPQNLPISLCSLLNEVLGLLACRLMLFGKLLRIRGRECRLRATIHEDGSPAQASGAACESHLRAGRFPSLSSGNRSGGQCLLLAIHFVREELSGDL